MKRFIYTTIYNSHSETLRKIATESAQFTSDSMVVQMFEAILREGDDRGLQMEWIGLQKLQPQLSDSRCEFDSSDVNRSCYKDSIVTQTITARIAHQVGSNCILHCHAVVLVAKTRL